jgi:hypothetical protein
MQELLIKCCNFYRYWLFRAWGRIGTTIGKNMTENYSKQEAIDMFRQLFQEKTKNIWGRPFKKVAGMYTMLELDYGEVHIFFEIILNGIGNTTFTNTAIYFFRKKK